jgi:hypothetical protein
LWHIQKCVAETVGRFGGFVAKYLGDGVLVYFGYPRAHEDDAERAVRAGLELIAALYRRRPVGCGRQRRMGHHQLPCRQRHHPADHRLVPSMAVVPEPPLDTASFVPGTDTSLLDRVIGQYEARSAPRLGSRSAFFARGEIDGLVPPTEAPNKTQTLMDRLLPGSRGGTETRSSDVPGPT